MGNITINAPRGQPGSRFFAAKSDETMFLESATLCFVVILSRAQ